MALDKIVIGARIRKIREEVFEESRELFGKRCDLTERHISQIERGEFLLSLYALDNIAIGTGISVEYILYGKGENNKLMVKESLDTIISRSSAEELRMYYKCITAIKNYISKINKEE